MVFPGARGVLSSSAGCARRAAGQAVRSANVKTRLTTLPHAATSPDAQPQIHKGQGARASPHSARPTAVGMHAQRRRHVALEYEPDAAAAAGNPPAIDGLGRLRFALVARFASEGDNCAVATRTIEAGSVIEMPSGRALRLDFTVLEGHRFAAHAIEAGELLTSWGSGFGRATRRINEGETHGGLRACHSRL